MAGGDITFVLTGKGHNAGIVSEPGREGRAYRIAEKKAGNPYKSPEQWEQDAELRDGSWWLAWGDWLKKQNGNEKIHAPKKAGNEKYKILGDAPGSYVYQK